MKTYSRIFLIMALALSSFVAGAKSRALSEFLGKVSGSCVSFEYSFMMNREGTKVTGSGDVILQDDSFRLNGNGLEMWCDGSTRWTVDRSSEEVIIESVESSGGDFSTNPALLVASVDSCFTEISGGVSKFDGKTVMASILSPKEKFKSSLDIARLKLYFNNDGSDLLGLEVTMEDDSVAIFKISDFKTSEKLSSMKTFRLDESTIDSSYVVTDLR